MTVAMGSTVIFIEQGVGHEPVDFRETFVVSENSPILVAPGSIARVSLRNDCPLAAVAFVTFPFSK